ncbi:MAG: DUF6683 family protein [Gammaproteobacteria bacterium]
MSAVNPDPVRADEPYQALDFTYDDAISKQVLAETVDTLSRDNPAYRAVVEAELAGRDIVAEFRDVFGPLGLRHDNLADTMAAYWISMWSIIHNKPLANGAQALAVRDQVLPRIASSELTASVDKRQMMGEALVYESTVAYGVYRDALSNKQDLQLRQMARSAKQNTRKKGYELAKMKLTNQGMRRR